MLQILLLTPDDHTDSCGGGFLSLWRNLKTRNRRGSLLSTNKDDQCHKTRSQN